mgnify:CR=1 FL=1
MADRLQQGGVPALRQHRADGKRRAELVEFFAFRVGAVLREVAAFKAALQRQGHQAAVPHKVFAADAQPCRAVR